MKLYIFGIGGSGARIVRSFVHLMASGSNVPKGTEIIPIIIDTDAQSKETENLNKTIEKYNNVQTVLFDQNDDNRKSCKFFNCKIEISHFNFESINLNYTFSQFLNEYPGQQMQLLPKHKLLMESLYDNSPENDPDTELNLRLNLGFKGNPNIGGIIFNMLDEDKKFKDLLRGIKAEDKIFIISSIFGGNGSSGFPALMNLINDSGLNDLLQAKKGALTVLPYYDVVTPESGGAINGKLFNSKSKSALSFYIKDDILNGLSAHYYLADGKRGQYKYSEGGADQENPASFIEFLGATSIIDFLNSSGSSESQNKYGFALDMHRKELGDSIIHLGHFNKGNAIYSSVLENMIQFAFAKKFFDLLSASQDKVPVFSADSNFYNGSSEGYRYILNSYFQDWQKWINELENVETNKRGLKFFEFTRGLDELINNGTKFDGKFEDYIKTLTTEFKNVKSSYPPYKFITTLCEISGQLARSADHPTLQ